MTSSCPTARPRVISSESRRASRIASRTIDPRPRNGGLWSAAGTLTPGRQSVRLAFLRSYLAAPAFRRTSRRPDASCGYATRASTTRARRNRCAWTRLGHRTRQHVRVEARRGDPRGAPGWATSADGARADPHQFPAAEDISLSDCIKVVEKVLDGVSTRRQASLHVGGPGRDTAVHQRRPGPCPAGAASR